MIKEEFDMSVILVEHDPEVLLEFTDRILLLHDGVDISTETTRKFYENVKLAMDNGASVPDIARIGHEIGLNPPPVTIPDGVKELGPRVDPGFKIPSDDNQDKPVLVRTKDLYRGNIGILVSAVFFRSKIFRSVVGIQIKLGRHACTKRRVRNRE